MTNEERHIAVLNRMLENMDVYDSIQPTTERKKAIKAAIKALEQQPCDAISREDAEQMFRNIRSHLKPQDYKSAEEFNTRDLMLLNAEQMIHALPSVTQKSETVTEFADRCRECGKMRKGHWIWNFDKGYCKCSKCGIGMGHKEFDYCPNCGAKMQESEE